METQLISLIASFFIFAGYVTYIYSKFGVLKSISKSYYELRPKNKWMFTIALWGFSIPMIIAGDTALMFLAGSAICFVGAAPAYKDSMTDKVHVAGAVAGIVLGAAAMWINYGFWWITGLMALSAFLMSHFEIKNETWWIEITEFMFIFLGVLLSIIR